MKKTPYFTVSICVAKKLLCVGVVNPIKDGVAVDAAMLFTTSSAAWVCFVVGP